MRNVRIYSGGGGAGEGERVGAVTFSNYQEVPREHYTKGKCVWVCVGGAMAKPLLFFGS